MTPHNDLSLNLDSKMYKNESLIARGNTLRLRLSHCRSAPPPHPPFGHLLPQGEKEGAEREARLPSNYTTLLPLWEKEGAEREGRLPPNYTTLLPLWEKEGAEREGRLPPNYTTLLPLWEKVPEGRMRGRRRSAVTRTKKKPQKKGAIGAFFSF
jgi:hypothetical protein